MTTISKQWWQELRAKMPVVGKWAYFDHAAVAPLPKPAVDAIHNWVDDAASNGDANWWQWKKNVNRLRKLGAELIGAKTDEIAIVRNTTEGVTIVAEGIPWQEGENIVTPEGEFPTNLFPWKNLERRGVEVRVVPTENERVDLKAIELACDSRTRLITVSWVGFASGYRNDLAALTEIAHRNGAHIFVDAIQGLGAFPLDVRQIPLDYLAADGHKWMLGPEGAGFLYVKKEHLENLYPLGIGWNSPRVSGDFRSSEMDLRNIAARYEGGSYNMCGIAALAKSLELLLSYGVENVAKRLLEVTGNLIQKLRKAGATIVSCEEGRHRSGIVACSHPKIDPDSFRNFCLKRGVVANARIGRLRLSPHAYTDEDDIARVIDCINSASQAT